MRVDKSQSVYQEAITAKADFDRLELRRCRTLLRRLRFLEMQIRENGGIAAQDGNSGSAFTEWEAEALEWILTDVGFIDEVSRNRTTDRRSE